MRPLTQREYILVAMMLALFTLIAITFGLRKLGANDAEIREKLVSTQQQMELVTELEREWEQLSRIPNLPTIPQSLNTFVENGARKFKLENHLQLNALTSVPESTEGIQVKLDRLNLDQLFDMLYFLENHKPVLLMEQLDILTIPRSNLLRASFRLYKQKKG
ncbi:MAG: type II secretion system protein M [SAR324 cluster bacterium]|nr:type II secretion system protein M [SAR324 cluster bacterium]